MRSLVIASSLLALAATGSVAAPRKGGVPIATPVGEPVNCIPLRSIRSTRVHDDRTIDFETNGRKVYRNVLPNSCPSLGFEERFLYKTSLSQLCSVDIITVLYSSPPTQGASCGLGKFQPVQLARR